MPFDCTDIMYLLRKKGVNLSVVARNLGVTPQYVYQVVSGSRKSERIIHHIEHLLDMDSGSLEITSNKTAPLIGVA